MSPRTFPIKSKERWQIGSRLKKETESTIEPATSSVPDQQTVVERAILGRNLAFQRVEQEGPSFRGTRHVLWRHEVALPQSNDVAWPQVAVKGEQEQHREFQMSILTCFRGKPFSHKTWPWLLSVARLP